MSEMSGAQARWGKGGGEPMPEGQERARWREALKNWQERSAAGGVLEAAALMRPAPEGQAVNEPLEAARAEIFRALASMGRSEELESLVKRGYSLRCPEGSDSLLVCAIRAKQGACVKWLLEQDESLANAPSAKGASPLEEACLGKSIEVILALARRADPLKLAPNGTGALKALAKSESPEAIKAFFARLNKEQTRLALLQKDHQGASGLMRLAESADAGALKEVFARALKCDALRDQRRHDGESALHSICQRAGMSAAHSPRPEALEPEAAAELVQTLLEAGFEPNALPKDGSPALLEAVLPYFGDYARPAPKGIVLIVKALLEAGADPRLEGRRGSSFKSLTQGPRASAEMKALMEASELRSASVSLAQMPFADDPEPPAPEPRPAPRL